MKRRLIIFDTTLREGEQAPGHTMFVAEKVALARILDRLNVDVIEAGFAASSAADFKAIQLVAAEVKRPVISSLCRAIEGDIIAAHKALAQALHPRIHFVLGTSDVHLNTKLRMSRKEALKRAVDTVDFAGQLCRDVQFTAEDAGRTDLKFLCDIVEAVVAAGASTVNLADTVGYRVPEEWGRIIAAVRDKSPSVRQACLSIHIHNDLGLALASTLAAVEAGVQRVECTINGLGDRAGICALEELVAVLKVRHDYYPDYFTDIHEGYIMEASKTAAQYTRTTVSGNKAVVGKDAGRLLKEILP